MAHMSYCHAIRKKLADLVGATSNNYVIDLRLMSILCRELLFGSLYEVVIQTVLHQVDGTSAKAASHDREPVTPHSFAISFK